VTRCRRTAVAVALLIVSVGARGQLPEPPHGSKPTAEPAPSGAVSPELETFGRLIAIQARPDQVNDFNSAIASTDNALQTSRELQRLGASAKNIALVNAMSLRLRDAMDDVEHYNGRLFASFTKFQASELKKLTKSLHKSYSHAARDALTVQQLMEPGKVVPDRLTTGAANLEKTLSDFRTDEIRLGREMGIQSK
jgi:hypothetical protein